MCLQPLTVLCKAGDVRRWPGGNRERIAEIAVARKREPAFMFSLR